MAAEGSYECSLGQPLRLGCLHLKPALTNLRSGCASPRAYIPLHAWPLRLTSGFCRLSRAVAVPLWMLLQFLESSCVTGAGGTGAGTGKQLHNVEGGETLLAGERGSRHRWEAPGAGENDDTS